MRFCGEPACSHVTILFQGLPGARNVPVNPDGSFQADALVPMASPVGELHVLVVQEDGDGEEIRAFGEFLITVKPDFQAPVP